MSKILIRDEAIKLRLEGKTYGQIRRELGIPKTTLSGWLKNLPLDLSQQKLLIENKQLSRDLAKEKYRLTRKSQQNARLKSILEYQMKELLPLSGRELFLAGVFLYWGEGEKTHGTVSISNSDPKLIKFALYWMKESLKISQNRIKVRLSLYKDMNINESILYWSKTLSLPVEQFRKSYIKKTNREGLTYKSHGHGTCRLYIGDVYASESIAMAVKAISEHYGEISDLFWYN